MSFRFCLLATALVGGAAFAQSVAPPKTVVPDKLAQHWSLLTASVKADVPLGLSGDTAKPTCATVSFVVEKDGSTSAVKVERIVPDSDLRKVAQSMGQHLRFEPTIANAARDRVFSWLIFPLNAPADATARAEMMKPCVIENLTRSGS